jgi:tetratricopeptide (TPR) repeat protein
MWLALGAYLAVQASIFGAPCWAQALDAAQQQEVDALTKQIEADPKDASPWAKRGFVYRKAHIWEKAAPDFEQALRCDPSWQQGYTYRAEYLENQGRLRDAIGALNKAEEIRPLKPAALAWRGDIFAKLKDYKSAIAEYSKSIDLSPSDYNAYAARACSKLALSGPSVDVENDLEKCLSLNPQDELSRKLLNSIRITRKTDSANK